jgi:hypothetical protein
VVSQKMGECVCGSVGVCQYEIVVRRVGAAKIYKVDTPSDYATQLNSSPNESNLQDWSDTRAGPPSPLLPEIEI